MQFFSQNAVCIQKSNVCSVRLQQQLLLKMPFVNELRFCQHHASVQKQASERKGLKKGWVC